MISLLIATPTVLALTLYQKHPAFSIYLVPSGESVLNFGAGPTIHAVISASTKFSKITLADYTEDNRAELKKWIDNDEDKFDWSLFFNYVAYLEGIRYDSQCPNIYNIIWLY